MATMGDDRESRSGFFSLCLNASQNPRTKHLNFRIAVTDKLLQDFSSLGMTKNAILNLKGIFLFYSRDRLKEAIECFKEVLNKDPNNKSAVAHLITVFQRLHMNRMAIEYKNRQDKFQESKRQRNVGMECVYSVDDCGESRDQSADQSHDKSADQLCGKSADQSCDESSDKSRVTSAFLYEYYEAAALAEQGLAYILDCYSEDDEWVRAERSLKLLDQSLDLIQQVNLDRLDKDSLLKVQQLELEVKYWLAQCCQKVHQGAHRRDKMARHGDRQESPYLRGIRYLVDITSSNEASRDFKAWAWTFLGVYFFKKPNQRGQIQPDVCKVISELGLEEEYNNPDMCFQRSFQLETDDNRSTETRIRYATYLRSRECESQYPGKRSEILEKAIKQLQEAWEICPKPGNWFAKTILAQINQSMHFQLKKEAKEHESGIEQAAASPNSYLDQAICLGEEALEINSTAQDLASVAETYYIRGRRDDTTMDPDSDDAMHAAEYFWQAVQSLGTEKKPEVHKKQGVFLKAIGEDRQAIECFKRGMEVSTANKPQDNFDKLFETFLCMYREQREDEEKEMEEGKPGTARGPEGTVRRSGEMAREADDTIKGTERTVRGAVGTVRGPESTVIGPEGTEERGASATVKGPQLEDMRPRGDGGGHGICDASTTDAYTESCSDILTQNLGTTSDVSTPDKTNAPPTGSQQVINEPCQTSESNQSGSGIIDLEVDASSSDPTSNMAVTEIQTKSLETWKYKQNDVLYEMAYWYQYALRQFGMPSLEKITNKYVDKFAEEMSMIHAYLEQDCGDLQAGNIRDVRVQSNQRLRDVISNAMSSRKCKEGQRGLGRDTEMAQKHGQDTSGTELDQHVQKEVGERKLKHAKQLLEKKRENSDQETDDRSGYHCQHCNQPYPDLKNLPRQNSVIPVGVPRPRNTYYKYDFYVIYSRAERDWVYYSLLQRLEKSYQFKGAIPERDYRPGHNQYSEMERCIKESLKVLIVLSSYVNSRDEVKSMHAIDFALSLHHDMARDHFIVPILKDRDCLPPRQLNTLVYVNAVESNAWEKIVRALEHM